MTSLISLLVFYFASALAYSALCGLAGPKYHPIAAFQIYALALAPALAVCLFLGRRIGVWNWQRLWPPTGPETRAALSSLVILTSSTLMLLSPKSMIAVLVAQAGCLCLVIRRRDPVTLILPGLSIVAVALAASREPWRVAMVPIALGMAKTVGYLIKMRSIEAAKAGEGASAASGSGPGGSSATLVSADDFIAAEQVFISLLALGLAGVFSHAVAPAPLTDWRLWFIAASSLLMGLIGTRIMLRAEPQSITFPAYRMMALLAAFGASWGRGELRFTAAQWTSWSAILLACVVVAAGAGLGGVVRRWLSRSARELRGEA